MDAAANLWLRREGTEPHAAPVVTGSHMDTQPNGGRFDGIYGVIAGLEALTALHEAARRCAARSRWWPGPTRRAAASPPAAWAAWPGAATAASRTSPTCRSRRRPLRRRAGRAPDRRERTCRAGLGGQPHAYVEAHIEQGPRLEAEGLDIGVVTGIQGSRWFTVTLTGETAHAGTTPLALRRDAVQDMVRAITALNALMHDPNDVLRFTVGRIAVEPNTSNSVANRAASPSTSAIPTTPCCWRAATRSRRRSGGGAQCGRGGAGAFHALPVAFSPLVIDAVERAAAEQGCRHMRLPSGAFHDAQFVVPVCPTGMIFVPCRRGISHNPAEYSDPAELAAGTRVLTQTLTELAAAWTAR